MLIKVASALHIGLETVGVDVEINMASRPICNAEATLISITLNF